MTVATCPEPCAMPIVFVPGIMGSRLQNRRSGRMVWDPDRNVGTGSLGDNAISGARAKRNNLVGPPGSGYSPTYLEVHRGTVGGNLTAERIARGWGGLHQGSYFQFMMWLDIVVQQPSNNRHLPPRCHAVSFEAFAHPYNWTDDNRNSGRDLARTVTQAVRETTRKYANRPEVRILKPVLVTHSMGGLVARAYTQIHGGAGDVHGVIHGAMPTDGAPATYKRMLSGFEGVASLVLGYNQAQVTATAGNMPGALQLLPNGRHKSVDGSTGWLRIENRDGSRRAAYPASDPYAEIYSEPRQWWRLIHEQLLDPEGDRTGRIARLQFAEQLTKAQAFHRALGDNGFHPNTRMFYADDTGHRSWDKVVWRQSGPRDTPSAGATYSNSGLGTVEWGQWHTIPGGFGMMGAAPMPQFIPETVYTIRPADAPGDGTVHAGSGRHVRGAMSVQSPSGFEHQHAFNSRDVRRMVADWLFDMVLEQL